MGKTELDSYLTCEKCKTSPYSLYRVQSPTNSDVFTHRLWPAMEGVPVPDHAFLINCPTCGRELVRSAKRA